MNVDSLVGTWRLVSFEVLDAEGRRAFPFGEDAVGFITYTADGRMAVQFASTNRPRLTTPVAVLIRRSRPQRATTLPTAARMRSTIASWCIVSS